MAIGLGTRRGRAVSLEEGAASGTARCPACGEPLFVWLETSGFGPREDELIDRCENCGLAVARDAVPSPDEAVEELLSDGVRRGERIAVRVQNAASLQAWLGAENWAALAPEGRGIKPTPRAAAILLARRGLGLRRIRHLIRPGMASMWQTLLNLLTFHRDFASGAVSGRLRPGSGRGLAAFWIDAAVTVLAAVPTAILAVLLESAAVVARRGGVIELQAEPLPDPDQPG
ncbi:MAG TPA: hypothetical protein VF052_06770 [Solirubrobacterales bacterium]